MNRIQQTLQKDKKILSIYFTAGYPELNDTLPILESLERNEVDMIEIGLPFSDPLADGPTIQESSKKALINGMTTERLFEQLENVRGTVSVPLLIMGYFNPILQYGVENFCKKCMEIGIDGLIIPDLPLSEYKEQYQNIFERYKLFPIFLITPQTSNERIMAINSATKGFIYMVSSASTTGATQGFGTTQDVYFNRIESLALSNPQIIGFGVNNAQDFKHATRFSKGAIIGSAFINMLSEQGVGGISRFVNSIR